MDHRRASAAESASSSVYSTQTLPVPPTLPISDSGRASQTSFASRAWIFGKVPNYTSTTTNPTHQLNPNPNNYCNNDNNNNNNINPEQRRQQRRRPSRPSHLEPVAIRDSVGYPSASSFEATIEKGTARWGRRSSTKPRLVDLGGLRRKVKRMTMLRRGSEQQEHQGAVGAMPATLREAFGGQGVGVGVGIGVGAGADREGDRGMVQVRNMNDNLNLDQTQARGEEREPEDGDEDVRIGPPTDRQLATMLYHEIQNDIMIRTRTESPTSRVPELPFRDKIRGKHFSRTTGNLDEEVSSYAKDKRRGCTTAQCVVI
ncbi:uncharacterized protein F4807DRAFT_168249 [Annulohypoxylon truncatum]|uniref:uncharacterized protein n=1 Tax=Annulohypoxylon truncatum TaxID=327061 RepID=UPI0020085F6F|nr:uncharacterized protein F4807DRAFT_168249 [Annulohypoxylon truncatum]KAI1207849.1 hypothetical protein F4807DRAFT_168249 [Annulohypoxylon truncatum]